jgi:hypothetical protein
MNDENGDRSRKAEGVEIRPSDVPPIERARTEYLAMAGILFVITVSCLDVDRLSRPLTLSLYAATMGIPLFLGLAMMNGDALMYRMWTSRMKFATAIGAILGTLLTFVAVIGLFWHFCRGFGVFFFVSSLVALVFFLWVSPALRLGKREDGSILTANPVERFR